MKQEKEWVVAEPAPQDWQNKFPELPSVLRQLLWNRDLRAQEAIDEFLNPDYGEDLRDPFLFKEMDKAARRVFEAIKNKEKIAIYGDYDADGVTGSIILETTLESLGADISEVHLPHREKEGYGLNKEAISHLISIGSKLIITCDCGIANFDEVEMAQNQGVDIIITDHHHIPPRIPPAFAILHPFLPDSGYPYQLFTGGAVAYKFACGLIQRCRELGDNCQVEEGFEKWLLDLTAISTVADVGKLIGENRTLVKYGLVVLKKTRRLGLKKLYEAASIRPESIDAWSIAYQIAPRINSAGRMNHASAAYKLLMSADENEAQKLASELNQTNQARQHEADRIASAAKKQIIESKNKYFLSAFKDSWQAGLIGLVAGKLAEEFYRPVVVGCQNEEGKIVGSARSIEQFNIIEAFNKNKNLMLKFGGHPKAAGFTVENINKWQELTEKLERIAQNELEELDLRPSVDIDMEINLSQADWELWRILETMEPFGEGNPKPKFLTKNLEIVNLEQVGNDGKHLRLFVADEARKPHKMIGFCFGKWCERLAPGNRIDVIFEVGINQWNGNQELQLKIIDLKLK